MKNLRLATVISSVFALTFGPSVLAMNLDAIQDQQNKAEQAMDETGEYITDAAITTKVKATILSSDALNVLEINVETQDGVVQLSGFVEQEEDIDTAEKIVRGLDGVKDVENDLKVKSENAS
jgi:hyperosmotically inducible protein